MQQISASQDESERDFLLLLKLGADKRQKMCYTIIYAKFYPKEEGLSLKYWRGYIVAAAIAVFTFFLTQFAAGHSHLVDMVYPYASRLIQDFLAEWSP